MDLRPKNDDMVTALLAVAIVDWYATSLILPPACRASRTSDRYSSG